MKFFRKIASIVSAVVLFINATALCGCGLYDLGLFENDDDYYGSFGSVSLTGGSGTEQYAVKDDLYNQQVVDNLQCTIPFGNYTLFSVPLERAINLDEVSLYLKSSTDAEIYVRLYKADFQVPRYDEWDNENESESESWSEERPELPINYLAETTVSCKANEWSSFTLSNFIDGGQEKESISFKSDDRIALLFLNNTAWGKVLGYDKCEFCMTAFLVRAI